MLPNTVTDPEYPDQTGRRKDGRNLIGEHLKNPTIEVELNLQIVCIVRYSTCN